MDIEDILTIIVVIGIALVRVFGNLAKFKREKPPAQPSESMREILESLKRGESRQVVITRDDGMPLKSEEPIPEAPPEAVMSFDANADAILLEEQQRYAALAAQAEASLAARTPSAYDVPEEEEETHDEYAAHLPDFVRSHARDAVALGIILAPPPGMASSAQG